MGSCSLLGSLAGATITAHLPGEALKLTFGAITLVSGIWMLVSQPPSVANQPKNNPWLLLVCALPIGIITGILGIGGGIVAVPVMTMILRFPIHNATATSLAMMIMTSAGGVIGYIINGIGVSDLPAYSLGYVNLQAWLLLAAISIIMAQVGATLAHRIPARQLRYAFIIVMFYMGLRMLGLFDWLGWPL
jgi:uncharacterized membrane protein YfcA